MTTLQAVGLPDKSLAWNNKSFVSVGTHEEIRASVRAISKSAAKIGLYIKLTNQSHSLILCVESVGYQFRISMLMLVVERTTT